MRILHTADWHLGDRLGRIDRTDDLRIAVSNIGRIVAERAIEVVIVAGDLFSELARPDNLRESIRHIGKTFAPFLASGGTLLAVTGNHDNESFCRTLTTAMDLAAPTEGTPGERLEPGRVYLADRPTLVMLPARAGFDVQFLLMPYPSASRYSRDGEAFPLEPDARRQRLRGAFDTALANLRSHANFDHTAPTVLVAHVNVADSTEPHAFRMDRSEDVVTDLGDWAQAFAYVALGHIHKPHALAGHAHVRYSGSIERLDLGEQADAKSVTLFELGPNGRVGVPEVIPIPASVIRSVIIEVPADDVPRHERQTPPNCQDLIKLDMRYTAGTDDLQDMLRRMDAIFPRWFLRDYRDTNVNTAGLGDAPPTDVSFHETVRRFVAKELETDDDFERKTILDRLEELFEELGS